MLHIRDVQEYLFNLIFMSKKCIKQVILKIENSPFLQDRMLNHFYYGQAWGLSGYWIGSGPELT